MYGILTNYRSSDQYHKELLIYSPSKTPESLDFVAFLDKHEGLQLIERSDAEGEDHMVMWKVGNTRNSRKDLEKLMTGYFTAKL